MIELDNCFGYHEIRNINVKNSQIGAIRINHLKEGWIPINNITIEDGQNIQ